MKQPTKSIKVCPESNPKDKDVRLAACSSNCVEKCGKVWYKKTELNLSPQIPGFSVDFGLLKQGNFKYRKGTFLVACSSCRDCSPKEASLKDQRAFMNMWLGHVEVKETTNFFEKEKDPILRKLCRQGKSREKGIFNLSFLKIQIFFFSPASPWWHLHHLREIFG